MARPQEEVSTTHQQPENFTPPPPRYEQGVNSSLKELESYPSSDYPDRSKLNKSEGRQVADDDHDYGEIPKWIYQNLVKSYEAPDLEMLRQIIEANGTFEEALEETKQEWKEIRRRRKEDAILLENLLETKTPQEIKEKYGDSWQGRIIERHESANKVLEKSNYDSIFLEDIVKARKEGEDTFSEWLLSTASDALNSAEADRVKPPPSKPNSFAVDKWLGKEEYLRLSTERYAAIKGIGYEVAKLEVKEYLNDFKIGAGKIVGIGQGTLKA